MLHTGLCYWWSNKLFAAQQLYSNDHQYVCSRACIQLFDAHAKYAYKIKDLSKQKCKHSSNRAAAQTGTNVRACVFNAGLLANSRFAFGRSCDWPTRSRFSVVFLGTIRKLSCYENVHVTLHASYPAFPMAATTFCSNVRIKLPLQCNPSYSVCVRGCACVCACVRACVCVEN
jgi:hypothetical protein